MERFSSSKNSTRTWVTVPRDPVRPSTNFTLANLGRESPSLSWNGKATPRQSRHEPTPTPNTATMTRLSSRVIAETRMRLFHPKIFRDTPSSSLCYASLHASPSWCHCVAGAPANTRLRGRAAAAPSLSPSWTYGAAVWGRDRAHAACHYAPAWWHEVLALQSMRGQRRSAPTQPYAAILCTCAKHFSLHPFYRPGPPRHACACRPETLLPSRAIP